MEVPEKKGTLRERFKQYRKAVNEKEYAASSAEACRHASIYCAQLRERHQRKLRIFGYWPFGKELNIMPLLEECRTAGDSVYFPRTIPDTGAMTLHCWEEETRFTTDCFGLREPGVDAGLLPTEYWASLDVIIVPGVAFDRKGGRLGLGAGYYDRFWHTYMERLTGNQGMEVRLPAEWISCVYSWQIIDEVPMDSHDIRVDRLFSEQGIIFCKGSRNSGQEVELDDEAVHNFLIEDSHNQ